MIGVLLVWTVALLVLSIAGGIEQYAERRIRAEDERRTGVWMAHPVGRAYRQR